MSDRMVLMQQIKGQISTHDCPECKGPAYCAMSDGKSASLCWCMGVERVDNPMTADVCSCRSCLVKHNAPNGT